jgi:hypothetical protein
MSILRRLALLSVFAAATASSTFAQERPNDSRPRDTRPSSSGRVSPEEDFADNLPSWYKGATVSGQGAAATYHIPQQEFKGTKNTYKWSVFVRFHERAKQPTAVRIFFPCKSVLDDVPAERLAALMQMNGAIPDSNAYFLLGGSGKDRMLYLVVEIPVDGLTRKTLQDGIDNLFRAAESTITLWNADMTKMGKVAVAEKISVEGSWSAHDLMYYATSAPPKPFLSGLNEIHFDKDGTFFVYARFEQKDEGKPLSKLTGTYLVHGDKLTLDFKSSYIPETYLVSIKDGKLTIAPHISKFNDFTIREEVTLNNTK